METNILDWTTIITTLISTGVLVTIFSAIKYAINMKAKKKAEEAEAEKAEAEAHKVEAEAKAAEAEVDSKVLDNIKKLSEQMDDILVKQKKLWDENEKLNEELAEKRKEIKELTYNIEMLQKRLNRANERITEMEAAAEKEIERYLQDRCFVEPCEMRYPPRDNPPKTIKRNPKQKK